MHTPLAVLGGGPGGYAAAFLAADKGLEVTLVEAESRLGGTCLLRGCIPSKALLHVARVIAEVDELQSEWGVEFGEPVVHLDRIRSRKEHVIGTLSRGLQQLAKRRKVRVIKARGKLQNSTTLALAGDDASIPDDRRLTFDRLILATGSCPAVPQAFNLESARVMDSTAALELVDVPETLLVVGGGYIGLEMGTVYAQLGARVSVVELMDGLLPGVDRDLVKPLQKRLSALLDGRIFLHTKVASITDTGHAIEVTFAGPENNGVEHYDRVLVAVGRRPNSGDIGLENTRVRLDDGGFVQCDRQQRTDDEHILAIGDVAGEPMLAHKATHEAKVAAEVVLGNSVEFDKLAIPAVVFTDPEIAWAGLSEQEAVAQDRPYTTATYPWAANGRAQALGRTEGLTKWLIDPATQRVLGCGVVGLGAGELIAEAVLAIETGCEIGEVAKSVHPHPTLSESMMSAGEVFFGTVTEIYKPRRERK